MLQSTFAGGKRLAGTGRIINPSDLSAFVQRCAILSEDHLGDEQKFSMT
jgi:hypothetical protein